MAVNTSKPNEVWYVDSGASNYMKSEKEWFLYVEKPEQPGIVETGDETPHTIEHVDEIPLTESCRAKRDAHECVTRPDNNKESGVGRTDR